MRSNAKDKIEVGGISSRENEETGKKSSEPKDKKERIKSYDYRGWDKFDIDSELAKLDTQQVEEKERNNTLPKLYEIKDDVDSAKEDKVVVESPKQKMTRYGEESVDLNKLVGENTHIQSEASALLCERERMKGNESFRSGSYDEALVYYHRALSLQDSLAVRNNIALVKMKKKQYRDVVDACSHILIMDENNMKALLRRASACIELQNFDGAFEDVKRVLELDPNSKEGEKLMAQLAEKVTKAVVEEKPKPSERGPAKRMVIEEASTDEED